MYFWKLKNTWKYFLTKLEHIYVSNICGKIEIGEFYHCMIHQI